MKKRLIKRKRSSASFAETVKRRCVEAVEGDLGTEYSSGRRRSARIKGIVSTKICLKQDQQELTTHWCESQSTSEFCLRSTCSFDRSFSVDVYTQVYICHLQTILLQLATIIFLADLSIT